MIKTVDEYRALASEMLMDARVESDQDIRATLLNLALSYAQMAELVGKKPAAPITVPPEIVQEQIDAAKEPSGDEAPPQHFPLKVPE